MGFHMLILYIVLQLLINTLEKAFSPMLSTYFRRWTADMALGTT